MTKLEYLCLCQTVLNHHLHQNLPLVECICIADYIPMHGIVTSAWQLRKIEMPW